MDFKPTFRASPREHRFLTVPPVIFLSLFLGAALLPLLLLRSAQRLRPESWGQVVWGISAWFWIMASVLLVAGLMAVGWLWRHGAAWLRQHGLGRVQGPRLQSERDALAVLPIAYQR